jgi:hypothetical protein
MSQQQQDPRYQHQQLQPKQQQQQQQQIPEPRRSDSGRVTRLLADILVFIEVLDKEGPIGLVFRPDKIEGYTGETFAELGLVMNSNVQVEWNPVTLLVSSVTIEDETSAPLTYSSSA